MQYNIVVNNWINMIFYNFSSVFFFFTYFLWISFSLVHFKSYTSKTGSNFDKMSTEDRKKKCLTNKFSKRNLIFLVLNWLWIFLTWFLFKITNTITQRTFQGILTISTAQHLIINPWRGIIILLRKSARHFTLATNISFMSDFSN